jgi:hypothetical protein
MLIPLGFLAGSGGEEGSTFELIESVILGSSQSSVTFSSLGTYASAYKHLQIRLTTRTSGGTTNEDTFLRVNGDTGSNYTWHQIYGDNGGSIEALAYPNSTSMNPMVTAAASNTSTIFSQGIIDLLDAYSTTKNKTMRSIAGHNGSTGASYMLFRSGVWRNTSSITSLTLAPSAGNFVTGSRFSLYGIKG